ncbi:hypothetical protein Bca4012_015480 [Brassica carinata]
MSSSGAPSHKALSKIACKRLQKELVEWQMNPPTGFKHKVTDNLQSRYIATAIHRSKGASGLRDVLGERCNLTRYLDE